MNEIDDGLASELESKMCVNLLTFLRVKNPVLNFLNMLISRVLLSFKLLFYIKHVLGYAKGRLYPDVSVQILARD